MIGCDLVTARGAGFADRVPAVRKLFRPDPREPPDPAPGQTRQTRMKHYSRYAPDMSKPSKPPKPSKKPSRNSKSSQPSSRKSSKSSSAPPKTKSNAKSKRTRESSSSSDEEEEPPPRSRKRIRKPVPADEDSEDISWVDRQDLPPPEEAAEGEPEKDTLEWHQWNLLSSLIPTKWKAPFYRHFPKVTVVWDEKKDKFLHKFQCKYRYVTLSIRCNPLIPASVNR
ncbi:hypothetical protein EV361DRAFT_956243 [Lentinula raphanica]|nr:hypothetical protein EV361DRAFT_956243 [Lentinula raphanica]